MCTTNRDDELKHVPPSAYGLPTLAPGGWAQSTPRVRGTPLFAIQCDHFLLSRLQACNWNRTFDSVFRLHFFFKRGYLVTNVTNITNGPPETRPLRTGEMKWSCLYIHFGEEPAVHVNFFFISSAFQRVRQSIVCTFVCEPADGGCPTPPPHTDGEHETRQTIAACHPSRVPKKKKKKRATDKKEPLRKILARVRSFWHRRQHRPACRCTHLRGCELRGLRPGARMAICEHWGRSVCCCCCCVLLFFFLPFWSLLLLLLLVVFSPPASARVKSPP